MRDREEGLLFALWFRKTETIKLGPVMGRPRCWPCLPGSFRENGTDGRVTAIYEPVLGLTRPCWDGEQAPPLLSQPPSPPEPGGSPQVRWPSVDCHTVWAGFPSPRSEKDAPVFLFSLNLTRVRVRVRVRAGPNWGQGAWGHTQEWPLPSPASPACPSPVLRPCVSPPPQPLPSSSGLTSSLKHLPVASIRPPGLSPRLLWGPYAPRTSTPFATHVGMCG